MQMKEAAEFREVKLKGKNHILKTGHYRLKNELKSDHKKVEQLHEQVPFAPSQCLWCYACSCLVGAESCLSRHHMSMIR